MLFTNILVGSRECKSMPARDVCRIRRLEISRLARQKPDTYGRSGNCVLRLYCLKLACERATGMLCRLVVDSPVFRDHLFVQTDESGRACARKGGIRI